MQCTITKIDEILFSGEAISLTVPGSAGVFTVLAHHAPMVSGLKQGVLVLVPKTGNPLNIPIDSGLLETGENNTVVLLS